MTYNNFPEDENRQLAAFEHHHLQPQPIKFPAAGTFFPVTYHHHMNMMIYAPPPDESNGPNAAQPPAGLPPYLQVAYYAALPAYTTPPSSKSKTCEKCGLLLCGCVISLILILFAFIVLQIILVDWRALQFEIQSFSMLNYENTRPNNNSYSNMMIIKAKWELKMSVCNHKTITKVSFGDHVNFSLNYHSSDHIYTMDSASVNPFELNGKNENCEMLRVGFSLPSSSEAANEGDWMKQFEEDGRKNNTNNIRPLSVYVRANMTYRLGTIVVFSYRLVVMCEDLPVDFRTPRGHRTWTGIQECTLFVY